MNMQVADQKLPEVTSAEYTVGTRSQEFHPEGLFSETIFGPKVFEGGSKESEQRRNQFAYIDLHCKILHPQLVKAVSRLNNKIIRVLERKCQYNFDENNNLVEVAAEVDGELNGVTSVIKNFERILNSKEEDKRIRNDIKKMLLSYFQKGMAFIDKCIVIPAFWRDAQIDVTDTSSGLRIPPVNEYYKKIIVLSKQIATMPMNNPGDVFYEICASKMQQLVNELCDYLITKVSKKSGIVRSNILGKRIDFCGRAVIVGGSYEIGPDEIGIPYKMLVKIYEPFLLHELYHGEKTDKKQLEIELFNYSKSALSIVSLKQVITDIDKGHVLPKDLDTIIRSALERVIEDKAIIAKRDPALRSESIRAYKPIIINGTAIKLANTACAGHNADYDGDSVECSIKATIRYDSNKTKTIMCPISDLAEMEI